MKKNDIKNLILLFLIPILLALILSHGKIYGSSIDWLSQHITVPEYLRELFYTNHQLIPDFLPHLQGGSNTFAYSYYGLLRPDILISYLFKNIPVYYFIIGYALLLWSLTGMLCYIWLRNKCFSRSLCLFVSILCTFALCFFHTHRQIIFVNILPFLFLMYLVIDLKKYYWIPLIVFNMLIHSYFYSIGALIMSLIYFFYLKPNKKECLQFCLWNLLGILLASFLWLPTGLYILENKRQTSAISFTQLFIPQFYPKGLLYSHYGCGLTAITWIALGQGTKIKKIKYLSYLLICFFIFPIFSYILNGTLYARSKILILCLPLILYILCSWLNEKQIAWLPLVLSLLCLLPKVAFIDGIMCTLLIYLYFHHHPKLLTIYLLIPISIFISSNTSYLSFQQYHRVFNKNKQLLVSRNNLNNRTLDLDDVYKTSNRIYHLNEYKTSSYTSTSNSLYNYFFYDIIKNPISQTNRTVNADSPNIFFEKMMSIQNIISKEKDYPGYHIKDQQGFYYLLENKHVFPLAYGTSDLISEKNFNKLHYPYTLDTLFNRTVVSKAQDNTYTSQIKKESLTPQFIHQSKSLTINKKKNTYHIFSSKKSSCLMKLNKNINSYLLVDFDVINHTNKKVKIKIDQLTNTLSKKNFIYYNNNTHFTYILSSKNLNTLKMTFSKGNYEIKNIHFYSLNKNALQNRLSTLTPLNQKKTQDHEILKGTINHDQDGYFVTSLPYQKGYTIIIDGKKVTPEIVNKAFLGCPISKGKHKITIEFKAPGKQLGLTLTIISSLIWGYLLWKKRRL